MRTTRTRTTRVRTRFTRNVSTPRPHITYHVSELFVLGRRYVGREDLLAVLRDPGVQLDLRQRDAHFRVWLQDLVQQVATL